MVYVSITPYLKKETRKGETIHLYIDPDVKVGLKHLAVARKTTFTKLVNRVLYNYYEENKKELVIPS